MKLTGKQRKFLRGVAHSYSPEVIVGKNSLTQGSLHSIKQSLDSKELIKIKFIDNDVKNESKKIIEEELCCNIVGDIGKILIIYRQHEEVDKRKIALD